MELKVRKKAECTLFYIKPDSMDQAQKIVEDIKNAGFNIVLIKTVILTKHIIDRLYSYLNSKWRLRKITYEHMEGKLVWVGIAEKKNAIKDLVKLCGEHFDPSLCEPGTIRRKYAKQKPIYASNNRYYYPNVIHRVKNYVEYFFNCNIFFPKGDLNDFSKADLLDVFSDLINKNYQIFKKAAEIKNKRR